MGRLSEPPPASQHPYPEPGPKRNAYELLRARKWGPAEILLIEPDSIVFRESHGRVITAWLRYGAGVVAICCEAGMPAEPSPWTLAELAREVEAAIAAAGPSENAD